MKSIRKLIKNHFIKSKKNGDNPKATNMLDETCMAPLRILRKKKRTFTKLVCKYKKKYHEDVYVNRKYFIINFKSSMHIED